MALKFLNKKGWHTGSLRNIENVWKAEQKHDAEQKKLEELRKQIHEERERSEFRQLQEAAGLVPRQERLDFLYESGLAVGKGSSEGFKVFQAQPSDAAPSSAVESSSTAAVPGALFEDKPHSANDAWRKLHSDPLLLIRRSEQEALARIKNNPIRMAMIQKSVESEKMKQEVKKDCKKKRNKHEQDQRKLKGKDISKSLSSFEDCDEYEGHRRRGCSAEQRQRSHAEDKEDWRSEEKEGRRKIKMDNEKHDFDGHRRSEICKYSSKDGYRDKFANQSDQKGKQNNDTRRGGKDETKHNLTEKQLHHINSDHNLDTRSKEMHTHNQQQWTGYSHQRRIPKITEEERDARLREMQMNAELHEDQRRKRLKRVAEADALEAKQATYSKGKTFLDATQKSVYGMEAGRSTIEESVRRRSFYSQDHSAHESNAFRR